MPHKVSKSPFSSESRDCNLILFGLPESKSIVDTKESVDEMLEFLAGKLVIVKDMFRLGKYDSSEGANGSKRPCPVPIKLTTPWDRKLILLRKSNLRNFKVPRLFHVKIYLMTISFVLKIGMYLLRRLFNLCPVIHLSTQILHLFRFRIILINLNQLQM